MVTIVHEMQLFCLSGFRNKDHFYIQVFLGGFDFEKPVLYEEHKSSLSLIIYLLKHKLPPPVLHGLGS